VSGPAERVARPLSVVKPGTPWAGVLSRFGTPHRPKPQDDGYLWLASRRGQRFRIYLPGKPTFLVICPKDVAMEWWSDAKALAPDVVMACAPFPTDRHAVPILEPLYRRAAATVFVGDLDPFAIVQYVETRRALRDPKGPPLLYGGINDAWLEAIARSLKTGWSLDRIRISLSKSEMRLLALIERALDLEQLLGPRSCEVLRGGHKIELEGAANPQIYPPRHGRWIVEYLRSAMRRGAGTL